MHLAGNRKVIYGAQQLAGKILSRKELDPSATLRISATGSDAHQTPQVSSCRRISLVYRFRLG